ncbi:MAG: DUF6660 family protein [Bacteroidota bacterium]
MKFFNFIFALYIGFVACYPCSDETTCVDEVRTGTEITISNHKHYPNEVDLCSPFCICSCCSAQIAQPEYFQFQVYTPGFPDTNSALTSHFIKSVSYSIWQPPKLV